MLEMVMPICSPAVRGDDRLSSGSDREGPGGGRAHGAGSGPSSFLRNGQEKLPVQSGGLSTPILLLDGAPPVKSSGQQWACPSDWKLWPQELLPQLLPGSASVGCEGARPAPGSWDGLLGHDQASTVGLLCSAGLGLPCPACRLPGSPRVLDLRLGEGPHRPCPGCPLSARRKPLGPAYSSAASFGKWDRPSAWPDPGLVLSVTPTMWPPTPNPAKV